MFHSSWYLIQSGLVIYVSCPVFRCYLQNGFFFLVGACRVYFMSPWATEWISAP
jgi:hypothetical protein